VKFIETLNHESLKELEDTPSFLPLVFTAELSKVMEDICLGVGAYHKTKSLSGELLREKSIASEIVEQQRKHVETNQVGGFCCHPV